MRHSNSQPVAGVPAHDWQLSAEGENRAIQLADVLRPYRPNVIVTSTEPKAVRTGELLADALGVTFASSDPAFNEHERSRVPWFDSVEAFHAAVADFFAHPDQVVLGSESADTAQRRFTDGVERLLGQQSVSRVAVVTHGTVMALFAAPFAGITPHELWLRIQQFGMPAYLVIDWYDKKLVANGGLKLQP
ncbi:MAG: histidine phosphatase family protein [Anaerolineae bacterium]|nr:histidine phosphatase family protein [Anaerolineae bacterium]